MTDERELMKKRLAIQTGLPLYPTHATQIENDFNDNSIIVDYYPLHTIRELRIDNECICINDCLIDKQAGIIYMQEEKKGKLFLQYTYMIPESDYSAIIDLMLEYENNLSWDKKAKSITEGSVTVSIDTSIGIGPTIQSMINDLKTRYNATARLI